MLFVEVHFVLLYVKQIQSNGFGKVRVFPAILSGAIANIAITTARENWWKHKMILLSSRRYSSHDTVHHCHFFVTDESVVARVR